MARSAPNPKLVTSIEVALRIVGPALDLLLAVGDRASRLLDRRDPDDPPARMPAGGESAPRGLTRYPG